MSAVHCLLCSLPIRRNLQNIKLPPTWKHHHLSPWSCFYETSLWLLTHLIGPRPRCWRLWFHLACFWLCLLSSWTLVFLLCSHKATFSFLWWIYSPPAQSSMVTYTWHDLQITPSQIFIDFSPVLTAYLTQSPLSNSLSVSSFVVRFPLMVGCSCPLYYNLCLPSLLWWPMRADFLSGTMQFYYQLSP